MNVTYYVTNERDTYRERVTDLNTLADYVQNVDTCQALALVGAVVTPLLEAGVDKKVIAEAVDNLTYSLIECGIEYNHFYYTYEAGELQFTVVEEDIVNATY